MLCTKGNKNMQILLMLSALLLLTRLYLFGLIHARFTTYSVLKNTVSDYGTGKARRLYSTLGVLSLLSYVLISSVLIAVDAKPLWLTLVLMGSVLGSILILFFPTDLTGSKKHTRSGIIHWILAIINFSLIFVFIVNADNYALIQPVPIILTVLTWIVRVTFYAFLAVLVLPKLRERFIGLTERLFLTAVPLWFIAFSIILVSLV